MSYPDGQVIARNLIPTPRFTAAGAAGKWSGGKPGEPVRSGGLSTAMGGDTFVFSPAPNATAADTADDYVAIKLTEPIPVGTKLHVWILQNGDASNGSAVSVEYDGKQVVKSPIAVRPNSLFNGSAYGWSEVILTTAATGTPADLMPTFKYWGGGYFALVRVDYAASGVDGFFDSSTPAHGRITFTAEASGGTRATDPTTVIPEGDSIGADHNWIAQPRFVDPVEHPLIGWGSVTRGPGWPEPDNLFTPAADSATVLPIDGPNAHTAGLTHYLQGGGIATLANDIRPNPGHPAGELRAWVTYRSSADLRIGTYYPGQMLTGAATLPASTDWTTRSVDVKALNPNQNNGDGNPIHKSLLPVFSCSGGDVAQIRVDYRPGYSAATVPADALLQIWDGATPDVPAVDGTEANKAGTPGTNFGWLGLQYNSASVRKPAPAKAYSATGNPDTGGGTGGTGPTTPPTTVITDPGHPHRETGGGKPMPPGTGVDGDKLPEAPNYAHRYINWPVTVPAAPEVIDPATSVSNGTWGHVYTHGDPGMDYVQIQGGGIPVIFNYSPDRMMGQTLLPDHMKNAWFPAELRGYGSGGGLVRVEFHFAVGPLPANSTVSVIPVRKIGAGTRVSAEEREPTQTVKSPAEGFYAEFDVTYILTDQTLEDEQFQFWFEQLDASGAKVPGRVAMEPVRVVFEAIGWKIHLPSVHHPARPSQQIQVPVYIPGSGSGAGNTVPPIQVNHHQYLAVTGQQVAEYLGRGQDQAFATQAELFVRQIELLARAYTWGRGWDWDSGLPVDEIGAVITLASARLLANPEQIPYDVGSISQRGGFNGWSLAELSVLNRYRKRTQ